MLYIAIIKSALGWHVKQKNTLVLYVPNPMRDTIVTSDVTPSLTLLFSIHFFVSIRGNNNVIKLTKCNV